MAGLAIVNGSESARSLTVRSRTGPEGRWTHRADVTRMADSIGDAQRAATREAIRRAAIARAASAELVAASRELRAQTAEIKRRIALRRAAAVVPADARVGFESDSAGD